MGVLGIEKLIHNNPQIFCKSFIFLNLHVHPVLLSWYIYISQSPIYVMSYSCHYDIILPVNLAETGFLLMCSAESASEGTSEGSDANSQNVSAFGFFFSFYHICVVSFLTCNLAISSFTH